MSADLDVLQLLAEAAELHAPSPWRYDGRDIFCTRSGAAAHHLVVPLPETWHKSQRVPAEVATFIAAASPAVVMGLVAYIRRLEADRAEAARLLDKLDALLPIKGGP